MSLKGHSEVEAFLKSKQRQLTYIVKVMLVKWPSSAFRQRTPGENFG